MSRRAVAVTVEPTDAWTLLLSVIRYSLGRQTYMTSLSWEIVLRYSDGLEDFQLEQIIQEVQKEVDMYRRVGKTLADEGTWLEGIQRMQSVLDRKRSKD